jgi:hypothetical protein
MNSTHALKIKDKYKSLPDNYFGFDLFKEIFQVIADQKHSPHDEFNNGLASADAAVRRLREEYYKAIKQQTLNNE